MLGNVVIHQGKRAHLGFVHHQSLPVGQRGVVLVLSKFALCYILSCFNLHLTHVRGLLVQVSFDEAEAVIQCVVRESTESHSLLGGVDRNDVALHVFLAFVQVFGVKRLAGYERCFDGLC